MLTWCASINFDPVTPVSQCAHHLLYLSSITLLVYLHSSYSFYFLPPHNLIPFFLSPYIIYFFHFLFHPVFNPLLSLPSFSFPPPLQIIHFLFFTFFLPLLTDSPSFHISLLSLPFLFLPFFITFLFFTSSCFCNHFFLIVFLYFSFISSLLSYSYHPSSITVFLFSSLLCHPIRPYQFSSFT